MANLPGASIFQDVHSAPLPQPGYPGVPVVPPTPTVSGQYQSKRKKLRHPRLDQPQASYSAGSIAAMYGYPVITAQTQWVAFISLGGGISAADVQAYCKQYNFPIPPIRVVSVDGATNDYSGDPNSADGENALDLQNIIGASQGRLGVLMYIAPNSGDGFWHALRQAAQDNLACAVSISWGSTEGSNSQADRDGMDSAASLCNGNSIPVFAASGDDGSSDGGSGNNDDYPASSPYIIGCGGTSLLRNKEQAWSYGGGGPSHIYYKPSWQTLAPGTMRGVPDVAANADPNSGYPIVMSGKWATFGGTSAVGPMWAAAVGLIVSTTGKRVPSLLTTLYQLNCLTDIIGGNNGAFQAVAGYDYCTGLGTPNKTFFNKMIQSVPVPPIPPDPPVPPIPPTPPVGALPVSLVFDQAPAPGKSGIAKWSA